MYVLTGQIVCVGERMPAVYEDFVAITFKHTVSKRLIYKTYSYGVR